MYVFGIGLTLTIWKKTSLQEDVLDVEIGEMQEPELEDEIPDTESIAEHKVKRILQKRSCRTSFA